LANEKNGVYLKNKISVDEKNKESIK